LGRKHQKITHIKGAAQQKKSSSSSSGNNTCSQTVWEWVCGLSLMTTTDFLEKSKNCASGFF
jgi:hypothetical protein